MSDTEAEIETIESLPLDAWHRERGARMVPFAGYSMPIQYEGILAEHTWTRENAGLFDVSHMGQLSVSGEGVAEALEALMPGDFSALKTGRMRYSMLLDEEGGILDDLMVTNAGDHYALVVNGAVKWDDIGHLREHLPDEITLTHHDEQALLALQGPKAADALGRLVPLANDLSFMQGTFAMWGDVPLYITRSGYTGEDGFEISVPADKVAMLADALVAMDEVKPIGLGARDSLRLEAGLPLYGHDITEQTDPVSADLTFAISKKRREQGGFPAAGKILEILAKGPSSKRVGMTIEGRMAAREGAPIFAGDARIGTVTSGGFAPTVGGPIAMGYVEAGHALSGTKLQIEVRGKMLDATVTDMPFVPHRYHRKKKA
ncbi:glycine cleavage system aminomethyltransferase GcvT [Croceicoccus gelatinilyticus]|uniref:glycine cleavage system aminomethyltransferase GcvT n=1 Tax=Croceicoccus gelatinilyticus TaxID=2835536 RepID=UPI001BD0D2D5|nr:glycine cleavage system aminomethyltransferase GcvT [Croceicoccus gelatinilyticus]MBS7668461.1 glycine cleavage system aminomethyltransferase GcvT [Croceicoccus gelatinilyticus]